MTLRKILHSFIEVINKERVVWYRDDYEAARDGIDGHTQHPELNSHVHVVRQAIENSDEVREDKKHKDRRCYYVSFSGDAVYQAQHMKAVVKRTFYGKLRVITAYFTAKLHPAEATIWTR